MAGEIHAADDVAKTHSDAYATFQSPNFGRLGIVDGAGIQVARRRTSRTTIEAVRAEPVALVTVALGLDASIIDLVRQAGARGIVIAATGAGNTHPAFVERASAAIEAGVPVVLTTRCPSGRARPAYGFPGGGVSWQRAGAVFGGFLGGLKARVLLSLALGADEGVDEIHEHFEAFS
jgi:L-asparaginase